MSQGKHKFSAAERYAVWTCHGRRCWFCLQPLELNVATIDHFLPESLLNDDSLRAHVFAQYGLSDNFKINSFSNWLPCHTRCNQRKAANVLRWSASSEFLLQELVTRAPKVQTLANRVVRLDLRSDIEGRVLAAIEGGVIETHEISSLLAQANLRVANPVLPDDVILLDNGYWVFRRDVAREGFCTCERKACVDHAEHVYCYFRPDLSPWVITAGLYWKCYDEIIECHRCGRFHERGRVGKAGVCDRPFANQTKQTD